MAVRVFFLRIEGGGRPENARGEILRTSRLVPSKATP